MRRETLPEGTSLRSAKDLLRKYAEKISKKIYIPESESRFFEQVADDWLEYKKSNIRQSTYSVIDGHTRNHLADFFGIQINRITVDRIEKWIADKQRSAKRTYNTRRFYDTKQPQVSGKLIWIRK